MLLHNFFFYIYAPSDPHKRTHKVQLMTLSRLTKHALIKSIASNMGIKEENVYVCVCVCVCVCVFPVARVILIYQWGVHYIE